MATLQSVFRAEPEMCPVCHARSRLTARGRRLFARKDRTRVGRVHRPHQWSSPAVKQFLFFDHLFFRIGIDVVMRQTNIFHSASR